MRAECRTTKTLGEPDAGNPQVRFDEGALETGLRSGLNGHEAGNGGYSQDLAYGIPRQRPTPPLSANPDDGLLRLALNAPAACDPPQCRPRSIVDPTATLRTRPWLPWGSVRPRRRGWRHSRRGSHSRHRLRGSQSSDEFIKGWIEVRTREDVPGRCEVQPIRNQATTQRIQENTKQSFPITHTVLYCLRRTGSIGEPWISRWAGDGAGPGAGVGLSLIHISEPTRPY